MGVSPPLLPHGSRERIPAIRLCLMSNLAASQIGSILLWGAEAGVRGGPV